MTEGGKDEAEALAFLMQHLGMNDISEKEFSTPVGVVRVLAAHLPHIVEKRQDARERYARFALATMQSPFEVWSVEYDDGSIRRAFIGLFQGKHQMLVVVSLVAGMVLWNFMHCDRKSLNKHRHGTLIFSASKERANRLPGSPFVKIA